MLTKYSLYFKKQFKYRWVRPAFNWSNYYWFSQWFDRLAQTYYYRGYSRYNVYLKLQFYRLAFRAIKKRFRSRKILFFVTCKMNRMLTKKQKNARMGKGVGRRYKWVFYFEPYHPLFIVYNCNVSRLLWIKRFLWSHSKVNIFWIPTYFTLDRNDPVYQPTPRG